MYHQAIGGFPADRTILALGELGVVSHGLRRTTRLVICEAKRLLAPQVIYLLPKCGMKWHEYVQTVGRCFMIDNIGLTIVNVHSDGPNGYDLTMH